MEYTWIISDLRINEVKSLLAAKRIDIVRLNETKIKAHKQQEVMDKMGEEWKFIINCQCMDEGEGDSM